MVVSGSFRLRNFGSPLGDLALRGSFAQLTEIVARFFLLLNGLSVLCCQMTLWRG